MKVDPPRDPLVIALFSEIVMIEQLARNRLGQAMPKGMELSHFMVLNQLRHHGERTPAQLARIFHISKGAMTNTVKRLDAAGHIYIRSDWDDARRKWVGLSPSGRAARDHAVETIGPLFNDVLARFGAAGLRDTLPALRQLREVLAAGEEAAGR